MRILIVEDEKSLVEILKEEFKSHGYDVDIAEDGERAMEKMIEKKPDLVLLDLLLPKKDGFAVMHDMKLDETLKNIPVVIISNLGQDEEIKRGLALGAIDYFVKSQHPLKEIVEKVRKYLVKAR